MITQVRGNGSTELALRAETRMEHAALADFADAVRKGTTIGITATADGELTLRLESYAPAPMRLNT